MSKARLNLYRCAAAIIAVAAARRWRRHQAPSYRLIAKELGFSDRAADTADEIWNTANGPDEGQETEDRAFEHVADLIRMERDA